MLDYEKQCVSGRWTIFLSFTVLVRVYTEGAVRGPAVTPTTTTLHAIDLAFHCHTFVEDVFKVSFNHLNSFLCELLQVFYRAET